MGVGSSGVSGRGTRYIHPSWYDGRFNEYGNVQIRSKRVRAALGLGVHHLVRFDAGDKWVIFEWMVNGPKFYACNSISTNYCIDLGDYYLKDVYKAALAASKGASYGTNYNCNDWCEYFARALDGTRIKVHWNCSCVL